uniref:ribitol 5-phosphate transferase FKRP isoform X2 n=1 Tax=Myxine glutinosa TaxID=7769 RepID=UPI00358EBA8E
MRLSRLQWILLIAIAVNLAVMYSISGKHNKDGHAGTLGAWFPYCGPSKTAIGTTLVLREFEDFANGVPDTAASFLRARPGGSVLVVSDKLPYPPLRLPQPGTSLSCLAGLPGTSSCQSRPELLLTSAFVLLAPDGVHVTTAAQLEYMEQMLQHLGGRVFAVAAPVLSERPGHCIHLKVKVREWTAEYREAAGVLDCEAIDGDAVVLLRTQTAMRGMRVRLLADVTFTMAPSALNTVPHFRFKAEALHRERLHKMHQRLGIHLVNGADGREHWYGCSKVTARCFGTVLDDMPSYLYAGRWTPPCCLHALRSTTHHVIAQLEAAGVRYWLEGGSLLGAARHGDIIPWDYDVDVGIYLEDVKKHLLLQRAASNAVEDEQGFLWEKAREGDFYRVHYSHTNRLHVDLWPFYPHNGLMIRESWIKSHPQDRAFPESFLVPLDKLGFAGIQANVPNNHRQFLELKFGRGVIENPQFPNPAKLRFF